MIEEPVSMHIMCKIIGEIQMWFNCFLLNGINIFLEFYFHILNNSEYWKKENVT